MASRKIIFYSFYQCTMSENEQNSSENKEIEEISEGVNPEEEEIEQPDSSEESNQEVEEKPSGTEKSETSQKEPEEPEQSWEEKLEDLDEPLSPEERKQRKKEEKKLKKERKRKEMAQKTQEVIDKEFLNIFNSRVLVYTIIFFAVVLANFILWTVKTDENALLMQWWQITITLSFIIGSALMLRLSRYPKIYDAQFADKEKLQKIVMYIFMIAVGFAITFLYYKYTDSIENGPLADPENGDQITIDALRYQKLFSTVLMVVFFGWNVIQIFFIRNAIDTFSLKPEISFSISNENVPLKNHTKSNIYNFVYDYTNCLPSGFHVALYLYGHTASLGTFGRNA